MEMDHLKAIEELNELSMVLSKKLQNMEKNYTEEIENEIGDVYWALDKLTQHYNKERIFVRVMSNPPKKKLIKEESH